MQDSLNKEEQKQQNWPLNPAAQSEPEARELDANLFLRMTFKEEPCKGLELLFRKFYKPLCSHAARFVYSKQIAEDLVSEVFFQFYRTKAYENITSSYTSYLFRSVRNECYTYMQREFGRMNTIESSTEESHWDTRPQPDAEMHYNNLFLKVNDVIGRLPTQCQRVFLMSRFESKKYNEIASELHISPKTVEVHISRALRYLRTALHDEWMISSLICILSASLIEY
ncbi:RNA polymerase sigma-70 factor [Dyadobacter aurulentus]|uniref:RNA polymerase sigma-70 factor n=1 Tax=Dyadobacter sp. UC 10 TaxID=2605428 RepID=UPI0011F1EA18|nr:RNA polymerase sigma-70 factor [Dyadobacter sp. UC 10]KAA0992704.1 RNA polymerase sigma-70 factor [Dyadobacter sp. UC 10]